MGISLQPDLSRTPAVKPADLHHVLSAAVALGRDQPDSAWLRWFYQSVEVMFPQDRNTAIACWARCRALAGFLAQPVTVELDNLRRQELEVRKAEGGNVDIEGTMRMEYCCRVAAAARHPLTLKGGFADGFPQFVETILQETLKSLAAQQAEQN